MTTHDSGALSLHNPPWRLYLRRSIVLYFLLAAAYGILLAALPLYGFPDRGNYFRYADGSLPILLRYLDGGILTFLANEPIWLLLNIFLRLFVEPEMVMRTLIGVPAFVIAYKVLNSCKKEVVLALVILFLPPVLKNYTTQLRQGVAIAFFLCGYMSSSKTLRGVLIGLTPFIHASFFFVVFILGVTRLTERLRLTNNLIQGMDGALGAGLGLASLWIAGQLGARQAAASYAYGLTVGIIRGPGIGFLFWLIMALVLTLAGKSYRKQYSFELGFLIFYLFSYFVFLWAGRVFENALVLVLLSILGLPKSRRKVAKLLLSGFFFLTWAQVIFIGSPMFPALRLL